MSEELPFKMDTSDPVSRWRAESFWSKEPETLVWLECFATTLKSEPLVFVDVGANVGIYSLFFLTISKLGTVIAFEPFKSNYDLLKKNIMINQFSKRAEIVNNPLSNSNGIGYFVGSDLRPASSGHQLIKENSQELMKSNKVQYFCLDYFLLSRESKFILKIDVDGNDFEILKGASKSLQYKKIISVLIETNSNEMKEVSNYLEVYGYFEDKFFNGLSNHSDIRRKNSKEKNRVFTLRV